MPALANVKHEAVLQAYLRDPKRIGWKAYAAVYTGCSQRAAETAWSRLLKIDAFEARRRELVGEVTRAAISDAVMPLTEVLVQLSHLGRSDIRNYLASGFDLQELEDLPLQHTAAIREITVTETKEGRGQDAREVRRVGFKLHDKKAALSELRRHHREAAGEGGEGGQAPSDTPEKMSELEIARRVAFTLEQGARAAARAPAPAKRKAKG